MAVRFVWIGNTQGWNSYEIYDDLLQNRKDAKGMDKPLDPNGGDGEGEGEGVEITMSEEERKVKLMRLNKLQSSLFNCRRRCPDAVKRMINELVVLKWIGEISLHTIRNLLKMTLPLCVQ